MIRLGTKGVAALSGLLLTLILSGAATRQFSRNEKAFYGEPKLVAFVQPGLKIKIVSAAIAQDGTITVGFSLTDPQGAPLDRTGISTPGAISLSFVAAYIPAGQQQYVDYITRSATGAVSGTVTQASSENNGVFAASGDG